MTWKLSQRSEQLLLGIHTDLDKVVRQALKLSPVDFVVIEGLRSKARQRQLMETGKTRTLNSRHITGHAVDLAPLINGTIPWHDWESFEQISKSMKQAARALNVTLVWGGDWPSFRDGPHYELSREVYP